MQERSHYRKSLQVILQCEPSLSHSQHLGKVLFRDSASPLDAQLQGAAWIGHVGTLDHHTLNQQPVLWGVPDAGRTLEVAAFALRHTMNYTF